MNYLASGVIFGIGCFFIATICLVGYIIEKKSIKNK
jgi:hypothetical protein